MDLLAGLNWLDLVLLGLLVVGLGIGYLQGMLRQVLGLAALYIGVILGAQYFLIVAGWILVFFPQAPIRFVNAAGFFAIVVAVTSITNWLVYDAYRSTRLRLFPTIDHLVGSLLGLATVAILLTIILPVVTFATGEPWPWAEAARGQLVNGLKTSSLIPMIELVKPAMLNALSPWLPGGLPSIFNL
jgi:uncharacterized membrane protein required for colicin V production